MAAVIYIICVVVGFIIIILWSSNDALRNDVDSLEKLVNDYNELRIKRIKTLEREIKTLKERVKALENEIKELKKNEVELSSPYSNF